MKLIFLATVFSLLDMPIQDSFRNCGVGETQFASILEMSEEDFDQDLDGGWRAISRRGEGCTNVAAEVIKSYIIYSRPAVPKDATLLRWHAAQMKATDGRNLEAIALMQGSFEVTEDASRADRAWNLYVRGSIAFLSRNKVSLENSYYELAAQPVTEQDRASREQFLDQNPNIQMPPGFVTDPPNLSALRNLLACYDASYTVAYSRCDKPLDTKK